MYHFRRLAHAAAFYTPFFDKSRVLGTLPSPALIGTRWFLYYAPRGLSFFLSVQIFPNERPYSPPFSFPEVFIAFPLQHPSVLNNNQRLFF